MTASNLLCSIEECDAPVLAKTFCVMHYKRWRRYGDPMIRLRVQRHENQQCKHPDGCARRVKADGWCRMHWDRVKQFGDAGPAERMALRTKRSLGPGRTVNAQGYVIVWQPERRVYLMEHRLLMEQKLARPLLASESVHHVNGARDDNRIENLELWVTPQIKGQRAADLVAWIVEHYPDLVEAALAERKDHP